ncbi:hypothetical protein BN1723_010194, partial [Verticillium longisporum]
MPAIAHEITGILKPRQRFGSNDDDFGNDVRNTSRAISTGIIVAIVLGAVAFIAFCIGICCCIHRSRAKKARINKDVAKYKLPDNRSSIGTHPGGVANPNWADSNAAPAGTGYGNAYGNNYGYDYGKDHTYTGGFGHTLNAGGDAGATAHSGGHSGGHGGGHH